MSISPTLLWAQTPWENPNYRQGLYALSDTILLDNQLVIPDQILVKTNSGFVLQTSDFEISRSRLIITNKSLILSDSLEVEYYVYPNSGLSEITLRDSALIIGSPAKSRVLEFGSEEVINPNPVFESLNSRGSMVRGISFGNNQGGSVQSSLDLQLSGKLSEDLEIRAAISDNNAPVETGGFSQTLNEFDQVLVEIYNQKFKASAGHLDLVQTEDFFGNFSERVTGLRLQTNFGQENPTKISATGSLSRGEFAQTVFNGREGDQGPYRLTGNGISLFAIILSGSEQVFIDGILMQRGEEKDYVMNYNTGELTFTSNRIITSNNRIRVTYLYFNRNYSRFLFYGGASHERENWSISSHFYSNGDVKSNPINANLGEEELEVLQQAGNDVNQMVIESAKPATFDANKIQYRRVSIGGQTFFEYTTDENEMVFDVSFSFVGANQGDYIRSDVGINGAVYEYVSPISGVPQGNYAPIRQLAAPERLQMLTLNTQAKTKWGNFALDVGISNKDLNLFSNLDDQENIGAATRLRWQKEFGKNNWQWLPNLEYNFIQSNFNPIQLLRNIEFNRDFNLENELSNADQHYLRTGLVLSRNAEFTSNYQLTFLQNTGEYTGFRHELLSNLNQKKNSANLRASWLNADATSQASDFIRLESNFERKIGNKMAVGARWDGEDNQIKDKLNNNFSDDSFRWNRYEVYGVYGDSLGMNLRLGVYTRTDDSARLGQLRRLSSARGINLGASLIQKISEKLEINSQFRQINYTNNQQPDADFLTGNLRYYRDFWRGGVNFNAFYELAGGTDPQREFEYQRVNEGLGIYKWTDYNGDGLEQLDEFEVAEFQDQANYIRVFTGNINQVGINRNRLNVNLRLRPDKILNSQNPQFQRMVLNASMNSANATRKQGRIAQFNPFISGDENLSKSERIQLGMNLNTTNEIRWGMGYSYRIVSSRTFLFTGAEGRIERLHESNAIYRLNDFFTADLGFDFGGITSSSDLFESRRFKVQGFELSPSLLFNPNSNFNAQVSFSWVDRANVLANDELSALEGKLDLQWTDGKKSSASVNFNYIKNNFAGNVSSPVANQMMEGLRPGTNFVWRALLQRELTSYLELNLTYDGRKTEENRAIHTGSIQLRARF